MPEDHPKVQELRNLVDWSEGQVWSSPEMHGNVSGLMKHQIDWIPLTIGSVRPTQGKTLAVRQVCGGSQSFNAVNWVRFPTFEKGNILRQELSSTKKSTSNNGGAFS